jgi:NADH:ubiquinone oxidoreductase subunit 4 (subunit M)
MFTLTSDVRPEFAIHEGDFIAFGLVLSITNINEIGHESTSLDAQWKVFITGISLVLICLFAVLFALSVLHSMQPGVFSINKIKFAALGLSVGAGFFSYSIYDRLSRTPVVGGQHD